MFDPIEEVNLNELTMKKYDRDINILDSIKINRTDGALVRVTTYLNPNVPLEKADTRIQEFLEKSIPLLDSYVPK